MAVAVVSAALALVVNLATSTVQVSGWLVWTAWAAVPALVLTAAIIERRRYLIERPNQDINADAKKLVSTLSLQWADELDSRGLTPPAAIMTTWWINTPATEPASRPVTSKKGYRLEREWLAGELDDILRVFRDLPARRLVILGVEGAGKTALAMMLMVRYLRTRTADEPIPVFLTLSSWVPTGEDIDNWLVRQLVDDYPDVCSPDLARELVLQGRVLPVLDGVDEVAPAARQALLTAIDTAVTRGAEFVLTVRSELVDEPTVVAERLLRDASIVRIEPLATRDAAAYLARIRVDGDTPMDLVLQQVLASEGKPLPRALTSPLMTSLAGYVMAQSPVVARDLANPEKFTDPASVESYLLQQLIPAAYTKRLRHFALRSQRKRRHPYRQASAQRWLTFLAKQLGQTQTSAFAWWDLSRATGPLALLTSATVIASLTALTWTVIGFDTPRTIIVSIIAGIATVIALSGAGAPLTRSEDSRNPTPRAVLMKERRWAALRSVVGGLAFGLSLGLLFGALLHLRHQVTFGFIVVFGIMFGVGALMDSPWGVYLYSRAWLAITRRLPVLLLRFLEDAHRRGVLRQNGTRYEFRHARVQKCLAGESRDPARNPAAAHNWPTWQIFIAAVGPYMAKARPFLARLCATAPVLFTVVATMTNSTSPMPYVAGDRPEEEVVYTPICVPRTGTGGCSVAENWIGYRWKLDPDGLVDTTFDGHGFRVLTARQFTATFRLAPSECSTAAVAWQIRLDGRPVGAGTLQDGVSEGRVDADLTDWPDRIQITARRIDQANCIADLVITGPTVLPLGLNTNPN